MEARKGASKEISKETSKEASKETSKEINRETNKASITALSVGSAFQRALNKYSYLFSEHEEKLMGYICEYAVKPIPCFSMNGFFARSLSASPYSLQTFFFNHAVWPYYEEYILLIKLIVKNKINEAILNGAKQIVFLGGGYDIRAFICSQEYPELRFYELDRGITRETKLTALENIPYAEIGLKNPKIESSKFLTKVNNN
jgi:hypothetical protein